MQIFLDAVNQLTDTAEAEAIPAIKRVADTVEGVMESSDVRARRMGPQLLVDLRIRVDSQMSASAVQQVRYGMGWVGRWLGRGVCVCVFWEGEGGVGGG
jgi:divalent metal cation (Fe/Co/Zn/Cd) transporter